jgi:hypothetical protein
VVLLGLPAIAAAHTPDLPFLQQALEHAWRALVVFPPLLLLPFDHERR